MKPNRSTMAWPLRCFPVVKLAGVFPMIPPGCNDSYSHQTIALHLHDYAGEMWIEKKRFLLESGDVTLSPSWIRTRYALPEGGNHLCIHFFPAKSAVRVATMSLPLHNRLGSQLPAARERFWRTIDHARQAGGNTNTVASCAASASLQELLLWLYGQQRRGSKPQRTSLVEEALAKLNQAIETSLGKPMLIGDLAAHVGLSSAYIARVFAQRYGMTLQRHLLLRRMELARHLLISSNLPIAEIGRRVGIPDPQYFNKQFRRVAGQSPTMYRRRYRANSLTVR